MDAGTLTVELIPGDLLTIQYDRTLSSGQLFPGRVVLEVASAEWLADKIALAAEDNLPESAELDAPPDKLSVFIAGGHRYDDINVNIQNERDAAAPLGRLYAISGMPRDKARELAAQIRAVVVGSGASFEGIVEGVE